MPKLIKIALLGGLALVLLLAAAAGVFLAVVDPNDYKDDIAALVEKSTGRKMRFEGALSLTVFPHLGITTGALTLDDDQTFGPGPFLKIKEAKISLATLPLLSGRMEVNNILLDGLALKLVTTKNGRNNWEFGAEKPAPQSGVTPIQEAPAQAAGSSQLNWRVERLSVTNATVSYLEQGEKAVPLSVKLDDLVAVNFAPDSDASLKLNARIDQGASNLEVKLDAGGRYDSGPGMLHAALNSLNLKTQGFGLPKALDLAISGKAEVRPSDPSGRFDLSFKLPDSQIKGAGSFDLKDKLTRIKADIAIDNLNVDSYLPQTPKKTQQPAPAEAEKGKRAKPEDPLAGQEEMLRSLIVELKLRVQKLVASKIPMENVDLELTLERGAFSLKKLNLDIADGKAQATAGAELLKKERPVSATIGVSGLNVHKLLTAMSGKSDLSGLAAFNADIKGSGLDWPTLAPSLNGNGKFSLVNGEVKGFQLIPEGIPGVPAARGDYPIESLTGSFTIARGVISNKDLLLKSPVLNGTGGGNVNLPGDRIDYTAALRLPTPPEIPVIVSGPLASPSYYVDGKRMAGNMVKGVLDAPAKTGDAIKSTGEGIKGLFGK